MRNDLVTGLTVSALIHASAFFGGNLFPDRPLVKKPAAPKQVVQVVDMPKLEPEEPERVETSNDPVKPMEFAPPMLTDAPQLVTDTSFVQRIQPPPPENVKPVAGMLSIPENRDPRIPPMTVFDPSSLDQQPIARVKTPPQYPFEMRRTGTTGTVLVDFIVDADGNVQNAHALSSSQREFEQSAVQAVSKWKFKAGRKNGRNVNTHMQVPILFSLTEE